MSGVFSSPVQVAGGAAEALTLLENRVQTNLLLQLLSGQEVTPINQLRNDEATTLGVATPVPSP